MVNLILLIFRLGYSLFVWLRLGLDNGLGKDDDSIKLVVEEILQLILLLLRILVVDVAFECDHASVVGESKEKSFIDYLDLGHPV